MTLEAPRVPEDGFGSLRACLVEGDPQSEKRARRIKQRAVAVSIVLQALALTALVLYPLLSKGERLSLKNMTPIPPYAPIGNHHRVATRDSRSLITVACRICPPRNIPLTISVHDSDPTPDPNGPDGDPIPETLSSPGVTGSFNSSPRRPPAPPQETSETPERVRRSELQQMAQLITRVEPVYPRLAIQIHREGRVELHALISTEGTIESLEVISGDPFFIQSAISAVREWRYRPTIFNGRPIEVDTRITVIYTLSH